MKKGRRNRAFFHKEKDKDVKRKLRQRSFYKSEGGQEETLD